MGIYSSGMSCWERRKLGLQNDHAGPATIKEETPAVVEEAKVEVEKKEELTATTEVKESEKASSKLEAVKSKVKRKRKSKKTEE